VKNLIALALLLAAGDRGDMPPCEKESGFRAAKAAGDEAVQCVLINARRLEPSGERADLVAVAALSRCNEHLVAYRRALASACGHSLARHTDAALRRRLTDMAIAEVVKRRAL